MGSKSYLHESHRSETSDYLTRSYEQRDPSDPSGASDNGHRSVNGPNRTRQLVAVLGSNFSML